MSRFLSLALILVASPVLALEAEVDPDAVGEETEETPESPPAEEPEEDPNAAEARMRFDLASTLYAQGRFAEALIEFGRSHELSGEPRLLHNMYLCERDAGNTMEAATLLRRYLDDAEDVENRPLLESRLARLEEQAAAEEAARVRAETAEARIRPPPPPPSRAGPVVLFAVGGAALAAAGGLAINVASLHSDLQAACFGARCAEHLTEDREALRRRAIAVDGLWAGGLVMTLAGVLWWVLSTPREDVEPDVQVGCGLGTCSMMGRF